MKKNIIRSGCFVILFILSLYFTNRVFSLKYNDGINGMTQFCKLPDNSVDVLILGSSHTFIDINTGTLWDEYGMASYILGGSVQPMWNTYYYLKEALKTQTPELIILEAFLTVHESDYSDDSRIIKNTYGMKWSKDKIDAIKVSAHEERWMEFLLDYTQYHNRYRELSKTDFLNNMGNAVFEDWKGFWCSMGTSQLEAPDVSRVNDRKSLNEKTEKYYRKTIELAQENDIPLLIVISPYLISEDHQMIFNRASDIADEYGVDFINYNLLSNDIGIDFTRDFADIDHLNYRGNQKYTKALAEYLSSNYQISDRRGDKKYQTWQDHADYISSLIGNQQLSEAVEVPELMQRIQNPDYVLFVSVDGNCSTADENLEVVFSSLGIPQNGEKGIWCFDNPAREVWTSGAEEFEKHFYLEYNDIYVARSYNSEMSDYINHII